jgi:predicted P-loop ATPase
MLIKGLDGHSVLDDPAMDKLWLLVEERFRFLTTNPFFRAVVTEAARRNSFHPVRDYLEGLKWDGVQRLDDWLVTYGGAEDTLYVRAVGAITLIAAVRRVRKPGCKFDEMLVLEGEQGTLKSTLLRTMCVRDDWFCDDLPLTSDGKKVIEQARGKWIVEAADMSGLRRTDVEHLKAMLSRQSDRARLAYGRLTSEAPRQFIIVGTTNDEIYLKDITGNRRFWPVKLTKIDVSALARDRDQLWAEAAAREAKGESIRLDPSLWSQAAEEQEERAIADPWLETLRDAIGELNGKILAADAWLIVGMPPERRTQEHNGRLGKAMRELGFERKPLQFDGRKQKGYRRGPVEEREKRIYCYPEFDRGSSCPCSCSDQTPQERADAARAAGQANGGSRAGTP